MPLIEPAKFVSLVAEEVQESILPHLVAIYNERNDQTGTAFLTMWDGRQLLVTAKHCLYGHHFNENPATRSIFDGKQLQSFDVIARSKVISTSQLDVAIVHVEGFDTSRVLPYSALQFSAPTPGMVSIVGYLARKFRRSGSDWTLRPKPFCHTDSKVELRPELVGVKYTNRAITTKTGVRELAPIPQGISGGPMLDTTALLLKQVKVCGIFTDERLSEGNVFGAHAKVLPALMQSLSQA